MPISCNALYFNVTLLCNRISSGSWQRNDEEIKKKKKEKEKLSDFKSAEVGMC